MAGRGELWLWRGLGVGELQLNPPPVLLPHRTPPGHGLERDVYQVHLAQTPPAEGFGGRARASRALTFCRSDVRTFSVHLIFFLEEY